MKIVLRAFGNKLQGVMEVPEGTNRRFKLAMTQPIQAFSYGLGKDKQYDIMKLPLMTICTFEWTGKIFMEKGHEYDGAKEYQLVDIEKK